jgi:hypothetical protein
MTAVQQNLHCMLKVVLVSTMVTLFFLDVTFTPYHNGGLLQMGLVSGSIVLNMILHYLHSACSCGNGGNHFLG